ncbi:unnamed protein product, partial [Coccothraustes coccothraustes]
LLSPEQNSNKTNPAPDLLFLSSETDGNNSGAGKSWLWVSSVCQLNSGSWVDQPNQGRQALSAASTPRAREIRKQASTMMGQQNCWMFAWKMETHPRARPSHGKHHLKFINFSLNNIIFIYFPCPTLLSPFPFTSPAASSPAVGSTPGL